MKKVFYFFLFIPCLAYASSPPLLFDPYFSSRASSSGLLFAQDKITKWVTHTRVYETYQLNFTPFDNLSPLQSLQDKKRGLSRFSIPIRMAELYALWGPLNHLLCEIQYEIFGYGYRLRTFSSFYKPDKQYKFYALNPKRAQIQALFKSKTLLSPQNCLLLSSSGYESCFILAYELGLSWLLNHQIEPRQTSLYLASKLSLYLSMAQTPKIRDIYVQSKSVHRHDWPEYFLGLYSYYPGLGSSRENLKELRKKAFLSCVLDPLIYSALISQIKYCLTSESLALFKTFLLPFYQLSLSPFGPEDTFGAFLMLRGKSPFYLYYKTSHFDALSTKGAGLENRALMCFKNQSIGARIDFWRQPKFKVKDPITSLEPQIELLPNQGDFNFISPKGRDREDLKTGFAVSCIYQYNFSRKNFRTFYAELGFKSPGYLPSETTNQALLFRLGLDLSY